MKHPLISLCLIAMAAGLTPGCSTSQANYPANTGASWDKIYSRQELDVQPKVIKHTNPKYPFALKTRGVGGAVVLECVIDTKGFVHEIRVVRTTNQDLAVSCIDALKTWRWTPGKKDGRAVACRYQQPFEFGVVD